MHSHLPLLNGSPRSQELAWLHERDGEWWEGVFDRIAAGEPPSAVSREFGVRYAIFMRAVLEDERRSNAYDAVLRAAAERYAHELVEIADNAAPEEVRKAKLRIEARQWSAAKWHRARYGEAVTVENVKRVVLDLKFGAAKQIEDSVKGRTVEGKVSRETSLPAVTGPRAEIFQPAAAVGVLADEITEI